MRELSLFFWYYLFLVKKIDPQSCVEKFLPEVPETRKTRFGGGGGGGAKNRLFPN